MVIFKKVNCTYFITKKYPFFSMKYLSDSLFEEGFIVHGFSGDADPRILKSMIVASNLAINETEPRNKWFVCSKKPTYKVLQDNCHVVTKGRKRGLNTTTKPMIVGGYTINIENLRVSQLLRIKK